jgi:hypothetical protein
VQAFFRDNAKGEDMNTKQLLSALLLIAVISSQLFAQEMVSFPARSSDLADGSYWHVGQFLHGCCGAIDLSVVRYDGGAHQWVSGTGSTHEENYTWDVPIYAPANGWIASCWRNFPDDPNGGGQPENEELIFTGGNHVVIITDEGNAISLNHLKAGTIRPELCPSNAGNTTFPETMDTQGGDWRVAAFIDSADRPRIREGEYIGRAGESGNAGGPHLHMGIYPVLDDLDGDGREKLGASVPLRFRQGWGHYYEASDRDTPEGWYRLLGGQVAGDPTLFHPSPYLRRADASAGSIKKVDPVFLSGNRAVTALINSDDRLQLTSWDLVGLETINRKQDLLAGVVKDVRIAKAASDYVLVAVRGQFDELKLIAYHVSGLGTFTKVAEYTAGDISALAMAELSNIARHIVTAVRTPSGNLKLIVWDLQFATNGDVSIERLGEAQAGAVSALALTRAGNFNGVFAAVRNGSANLEVIPWKISSDGYTLTKGDEGSSGQIGYDISAAHLAQGVAVAVTDSEGKLRVKTWESSSGGDITAIHDTLVEGAVTEIDLFATPHSGSNLTAAVRDSEGALRLIGVLSNGDGTNLRRVGSSKAGAASHIAAAGVSRSYYGLNPRDMILTAMRDSGGDLKLISWDTNLVNP